MKKSQIAMLGAAGLIILIMLIVMGIGRSALGKTLESPSAGSITEYDLRGT